MYIIPPVLKREEREYSEEMVTGVVSHAGVDRGWYFSS